MIFESGLNEGVFQYLLEKFCPLNGEHHEIRPFLGLCFPDQCHSFETISRKTSTTLGSKCTPDCSQRYDKTSSRNQALR